MRQRNRAFLVTFPGGASVVVTGVDYTIDAVGSLTIWQRVPVITWTDDSGRMRRAMPSPDDVERFNTYAPGTWERIEAK